jgi:hypothetical protein
MLGCYSKRCKILGANAKFPENILPNNTLSLLLKSNISILFFYPNEISIHIADAAVFHVYQ